MFAYVIVPDRLLEGCLEEASQGIFIPLQEK